MEINFLQSKYNKLVLSSAAILLLLTLLLGYGFFSKPDRASAAAVSWTGLGDGTNWEDAANWSSDPALPGADDDVTIDGATVEVNGQVEVNSLDIGSTTAATLIFDYDALTTGALILDDGNFNLASGSTITHTEGTDTVTGSIYIDVQTGTTDIDGTIDVDERGYTAGEGAGAGQDNQAGAGHGGQGGRDVDVLGIGGPIYGSLTAPVAYGSGGGDGNADGGGAVRINSAGDLTIDGSITADAGDAGAGSGTGFAGGSGGSIYLTTGGTLAGTGSLTADGGDGGSQLNSGGAGGGGRISLTYLVDSSSFSEMHAAGGTRGTFSVGDSQGGDGGSGTIYLFDSNDDTNGHVVIDNNDYDPTFKDYRDGRTPLGTLTLDSLTVQNYGTFENESGETLTVGTFTWSDEAIVTDSGGTFAPLSGGGALTVPSTSILFANTTRTFSSVTVDGTITHSNNYDTQVHTVDLNATGSFTVSGTGAIDVNHRGYEPEFGPGTPTSSSSGAGHGGQGGIASNATTGGGAQYGSLTAPTLLGSGSGLGENGRGGGAIEIDAGSMVINGDISADGRNGISFSSTAHGGGSGGSIYLKTTGDFSGTGTITADGGNGGNQLTRGAGGAGGRITINYLSNSSSLAELHAAGGETPNSDESGDGGSGTVYLLDTDDDTNGHLIIDNDDYDATTQDFRDGLTSVGNISFDSCTIRNFGILEIPSGETVVCSSLDWSNEAVLYDNGGTFTLLSGGGALTVPSTSTLFANTDGRTYTSITVDGVLTHSNNNDSQAFDIDISTSGALTVSGTGSIDVDYRGYFPGEGTGVPAGANGGGAHGGNGGDGSNQTAGGDAYGSVKVPITIGSAAADGGARGGGAVEISATSIDIDGAVSADGRNGSGTGSNGRGGGAGGSIYLTTTGALTGSGSVTATGGNGVSQLTSGGGGSGGRVAFYYLSDASSFTYNLAGGTGGAGAGGAGVGGAGTLFTMDTDDDTNGHLVIDNNDITDYSTDLEAGRTPLTTSTFDTITVSNFGNLELNSGETISYTTFTWSNEGVITDFGGSLDVITSGGDVTIPATSILFANTARTFTNLYVDGTLTHSNNNAAETHKIDLTAMGSGDVVVSGTGSIDVTGRGYYGGNGPGAGNDAGNWGTGAGHGGIGGTTDTGGAGGTTYGDEEVPETTGSSGGSDGGNEGGSGGGAVKLTVENDLTVNGSIVADAADDALGDAGGGSGGSVYLIVTNAVIGSGAISADGGNGEESRAGAGAGGRIRVECADGRDWTPNVSVVGGAVGNPAGDGTYSDECSGKAPSAGSSVVFVEDPEVTIENGAECTTDSMVTIEVSAENASSMIISEDMNFTDAEWESYSPTTEFVLSEVDGPKTVYVRFRSNSQNVSQNVSDQITLDTVNNCEDVPEDPEEDVEDPDATEDPLAGFPENYIVGCDGLPVPDLTEEERAKFKIGISPEFGEAATVNDVKIGAYIRSESNATVYCVDRNFTLRPFLDEITYFTYRRTFTGNVLWVTDQTANQMTVTDPMLPNPDVTLVKFITGPEVYLSELDPKDPTTGILMWIMNEETAAAIAGEDWAEFVIDVNLDLLNHFNIGEPIDFSDEDSIADLDLRKRLLLNEKNKDQSDESDLIVSFFKQIFRAMVRPGL